MLKKFILKRTFLANLLIILLFITTSSSQSKALDFEGISRISRAVYLIQHQYYDPKRIEPKKMFEAGLHQISQEIPEFLPEFSHNKLNIQIDSYKTDIDRPTFKRMYDFLEPTQKIFSELKNHYKGEVKLEDVEYAFINGMLSTLDPHSNAMSPKYFEEFKTQTEGEYGGLGIVIGIRDEELTIREIMDETPASRAKLVKGEKIIQIEDQSTLNMPLSDAVDLMRGKPGTKVTLRIRDKNKAVRPVTLVREAIALKSVKFELVRKNNRNFGVIALKAFQEETADELQNAFVNLYNQTQGDISGIILDLRNNPGGLLPQAALVVDRFLSKGDIVFTVGASGQDEDAIYAEDDESDVRLPLAVLINQGSASAAEIVAGALKNNNRALIIGQTSFGKGSVQTLFPLRDNGGIKITIAQYLTAGHESIQAVGITPDVYYYPSTIGKNFYDLIENQHYGENNLDAHLNNDQFVRQKTPSAYSLSYLVPTDLTDEEAEEEASSITAKIDPQETVIQFASDLLWYAQPEKSKWIKQIAPLIEKHQKEENKKLADKLLQKSTDWNTTEKTKSVDLNASHSLEFTLIDKKTQSPVSQMSAGHDYLLKATFNNTSDQDLARVVSVLDSQAYVLRERELVFGYVSAHQSKTQTIEINLPKTMSGYIENIPVKTYSQNQILNNKHYFSAKINPADLPHFAYQYRLFDGFDPDLSRGNKNGIPEANEKIQLRVGVKNIGTATAERATLNIQNKEGRHVFLEKARQKLDSLKPSEEIFSLLNFEVKPTFENKMFQLDLFIDDEPTLAILKDSLKFDLATTPKVLRSADQWFSSPFINVMKGFDTASNQIDLEAQISDESGLKDIVVFVKQKKVLYKNYEGNSIAPLKADTVKQKLLLEDGLNNVVIQVRNANGIIATESFAVTLPKKD